MVRGSSAGSAPRSGGSSSAASSPGSLGERCQRPLGCSEVAAVSATILSASVGQSAAAGPAACWAMARSPAAQVSRLWVQGRLSISQMPASGSLQRAAIAGGENRGRLPGVGVHPVVTGGGGEQQEALAEGVELELLVDPVADDVVSAGVAGQVQGVLVGDRVPGAGVGGGEVVAVGEDSVGDEADGVVQQRVRAGGGDGLAGVALVADPDVPVVVVTAGFGPFGQAGGGGGDHPAGAAGQAAEHRVGMLRVRRGVTVLQRGNSCGPRGFGGGPGGVRVGRLRGQWLIADLQDQVVMLPAGHGQLQHQTGVAVAAPPPSLACA